MDGVAPPFVRAIEPPSRRLSIAADVDGTGRPYAAGRQATVRPAVVFRRVAASLGSGLFLRSAPPPLRADALPS